MPLFATQSFSDFAGEKFETFMSIAERIVKRLGIKNAAIFLDAGEWPSAQAEPYPILGDDAYLVSFNSREPFLTNGEFAFIAAHELRHVYQFWHKMLAPIMQDVHDRYCETVIGRAILWKEELYYIPAVAFKKEEYYQLPWEADANQFALNFVLEESNFVAHECGFWGSIFHTILNFYHHGIWNGVDYRVTRSSRWDGDYDMVYAIESFVSDFRQNGFNVRGF